MSEFAPILRRMKMSGGVEWAVHCCVVLSQAEGPVPGHRLALFHGVSASYLAKHLQALSRAGIVRSTQGQTGGYELTRASQDITVLDVVQAIEGGAPAFRCTEIRRRGPLGMRAEDCRQPCGIAVVMRTAEDAWRRSLASVSIADLAAGLDAGPTGPALPGIADWLRAGS
jgi:Rrf2 family protein